MLILKRKKNERARILTPEGHIVWISVVEIDKGRVRLGFDADPSIVIDREEVVLEKLSHVPRDRDAGGE